MKVDKAYINYNELRFEQHTDYGVEDGLPEGYTLHLHHTATPMKDRDTVYSNYHFNGWTYSPQTLVLFQNFFNEDGTLKESRPKFQETINTNCLYWLDIHEGIICYSSSAAKYENFVLYNIYNDKKVAVDIDYVEDHAKVFDYGWFTHYTCFYEPRIYVKDNLVFVKFEGFIGDIDPESDGDHVFCFNKDTLEPVSFDDINMDPYEAEDLIDERFGHTCRINLYPSYFDNRYNQKELSSKVSDTASGEHKYPDVPKSLIKEMQKLRIAWAKENGIRVEKCKYYKDSIYKKLAHFFEKLENKRFQRHLNRQRKRKK